MRPTWLAALVAAVGLGCGDTTGPNFAADMSSAAGGPGGAARITVLTQNMDPGTNLDDVITALGTPDPTDDLPALLFAIQTLLETDYPSRAAGLADEIARVRPHAVGLQEVSTFDIAAEIAGTHIQIDFLPVLEAALAARGLHYIEAGVGTNYTLSPIPGITYSQGDALLVDADRVGLSSAAHHIFATNIGEVAPGIVLRQGWSVADATIGGRRVIFVNTHPESDAGPIKVPLLRAAQLAELVGTLPTSVPTVLMGDLNDVQGSPMYQVLIQAGMIDVWRALRPGVVGNTCCHTDNLAEQVPHLTQRIDYAFARDVDAGPSGLQGQVSLFGDQPSERTPGPAHPLWVSDHVGIVATLLTPASR